MTLEARRRSLDWTLTAPDVQPEDVPWIEPEVELVELGVTEYDSLDDSSHEVFGTDAYCGYDEYLNVDGSCVERPDDHSSGATAQCSDGTYSYSLNRRGTCSHHGGVAQWY